MGRLFFVEKVHLIFFFTSSTKAPKNKSKRGALFSECGGAYERLLRVSMEKEKNKNHSILTTKTRLHLQYV